MKKIIPILMLLVAAALISISCKSTPLSTDALDESMNKAKAARQRAIDFESPAYFPSEWETLEAQYETLGELPVTTAVEIEEAAKAYDETADLYDELFMKTIPLYAQAREDEIMSAREELINTGFTRMFPNYLKTADDITLEALDQYEAGDYYAARDTAAKAQDEYETLMLGANVYLARQEVIDRGFTNYDNDNFLKANEVANTAIAEFEAGNRDTAVQLAEESLLRYNLVLHNGWTVYATERQKSASTSRELALAERANIASRELFREAEALFKNGEDALSAELFHEAANLYTDAEVMYTLSRKDTEERRQIAETAIRQAEERVEASNETAAEAERIIEGGSR